MDDGVDILSSTGHEASVDHIAVVGARPRQSAIKRTDLVPVQYEQARDRPADEAV
jgi:hypothetical protein